MLPNYCSVSRIEFENEFVPYIGLLTQTIILDEYNIPSHLYVASILYFITT